MYYIYLVNYSLEFDNVLYSLIREDIHKAQMIYEEFQIAKEIPVTSHFLKNSHSALLPSVFPVSRESEDAAWVFK